MSKHFLKRLLLPAALALAIVPLAAQAGDDLSYNYLQAGYDSAHNGKGNTSHGWSGTASAAVGQHFQVFGGGNVTDRSNDHSGQGWNVGGGFHTPISGRTDLIGDLDYHHANFDGVTGDIKTWSGEVGVRSALAQHVEGWAMAGYSNADNNTGDVNRDSKDRVFGKLGGQYKFDKNWGLVAEGRIANGGDRSIFVGPRFSF